MSNFTFCHNVLKICLLQLCKNMSVGGKGLIHFNFVGNLSSKKFIYLSGFTPLSTLFQLYQGDSSLIHDPWVNKPVLSSKKTKAYLSILDGALDL